MRVFVTDGDNRAALAVTRSLGRAGHEVVVGEKRSPSLAQSSRFCANRVTYPDPVIAPDDFVAHLAQEIAARGVDVLIPIADITTFLVTQHRDRFRSCAVPFADASVVERAADKVDLMRTAMRVGVPVPKTIVVTHPPVLPTGAMDYPVVVKPRQSRIRLPQGWVSTNVSYAKDAEQLARDLAARPAHEFPVMLQERIVGSGLGVFACYHEGRPVAMFSHRRLRERPPWGGVSVLAESVALSPRAREYATTLLDELGWRGVAMVEFKVDERDGLPKLMEINGRFWGSLQLAIDAGVDFPNILVRSAMGEAFGPQPPYRTGVRNRWFWGDVDSLITTLFSEPKVAGGASGSLAAIWRFMEVRSPDLYYDNPKWEDVRPWLFETYQRFEAAARSLPRRRNGRGSPKQSSARPGPPATAPLRTCRTRSIDGLRVDAKSWNELASRSRTNTVFQTYEWTRSWLDTFGSDYDTTLIAISDGSRVRGIAPLAVDRRTSDGVVRFVGDGRADYLDFIAGEDAAGMVSAVFDALASDSGWNKIELNNIPAASSSIESVREVCGLADCHVHIEDQYACPTLIIQGREREAEAIVNKPSLRRRTNYFNRNGRLVYRNLTTAAEIEPYLDAFFDQHVKRWATHAGSSSLFLDARNRDFYRELTQRLSPTGWLLFSVVEFNDHPIAFHYGFDYNGSVIWYKPSFDVAYEQHSPGIVMVRHLIGYALSAKRRELDFTVGDEPFKRRFTNDVRKTVHVQVFRDPARYYWELSKRGVAATMRKMSR